MLAQLVASSFFLAANKLRIFFFAGRVFPSTISTQDKWMQKKTKNMATSAETPQDHGVPQDRKGGNILTARWREPRVRHGFLKSCFPSK